MSRKVHRGWGMVSGGESIVYKFPGVDNSQIGNDDIQNNREGCYFNTPSDGKTA